jgi:hypothetical protein
MSKVVKLLVSIFVGLDILAVSYFGLANLRVALFGKGEIPGGGSAIDMAFFLLPLFVAYVAADRLYYFLTYKERKEAQLKKVSELRANPETDPETAVEEIPATASIWDDRGWDESGVEEKSQTAKS